MAWDELFQLFHKISTFLEREKEKVVVSIDVSAHRVIVRREFEAVSNKRGQKRKKSPPTFSYSLVVEDAAAHAHFRPTSPISPEAVVVLTPVPDARIASSSHRRQNANAPSSSAYSCPRPSSSQSQSSLKPPPLKTMRFISPGPSAVQRNLSRSFEALPTPPLTPFPTESLFRDASRQAMASVEVDVTRDEVRTSFPSLSDFLPGSVRRWHFITGSFADDTPRSVHIQQRPPIALASIVALGILNSRQGVLRLSDIRWFIFKNFPFFRAVWSPNKIGCQAVKRILKSDPRFRRLQSDRRQHHSLWTLHPVLIKIVIEEVGNVGWSQESALREVMPWHHFASSIFEGFIRSEMASAMPTFHDALLNALRTQEAPADLTWWWPSAPWLPKEDDQFD